MKTASQAYKESIKNLEDKTKKEFTKIESQIEAAIKNGDLDVTITDQLSANLISKLRFFGYTVEKKNDNRDNWYLIGWPKPVAEIPNHTNYR